MGTNVGIEIYIVIEFEAREVRILPTTSGMRKASRVLLVIAHPDDEVMFFTPLLKYFQSTNAIVSILCLSDGNFEGIGNVRSLELLKCAAMFSISANDVHIVNHDQLQDGMKNDWPTPVIAEIVQRYILSIEPSLVVTFDERGVSEHPNHIATFHGVRMALSNMSKLMILTTPPGLKLQSNHVLRKFSGIFDLPLACLYSDHVVVTFGLITALRGMYLHRSQNQLYRQVFVLLSSFTYINAFAPIL